MSSSEIISSTATKKLSFPLHLIIHHLQSLYGYHQHNYHQYLTYLTHRLSTLRKSLRLHHPTATASASNVPASSTPSSVASATAAAGEGTVPPPTHSDESKNMIRSLLIQLLLVERSSCQSSQAHQNFQLLQSASSTTSTTSTSSRPLKNSHPQTIIGTSKNSSSSSLMIQSKINKLSHHEKKKLSKSISLAQNFVQMSLESCDETTVLESKAYLYSLIGTFYFQQEDWKLCLENYLKAIVIYQQLVATGGGAGGTATGVSSGASSLTVEGEEELLKALPFLGNVSQRVGRNKAVYQLALETLEPQLRFCRYQLGLPEPTHLLSSTSAGGVTGVSSLIELFSDDPEMLNKLETIRLKTLTAHSGHEEMKSVGQEEEEEADPIYQLFNTIVWCNRHVHLPRSDNNRVGQDQQERLISSLYASCGKLISYLELQQPSLPNPTVAMMNNKKNSSGGSNTVCVIPSLYLPQVSSVSSNTQAITHFLSLVQEIITTVTRLINHTATTATTSTAQHLTTESLKHFQQYFVFLQYHTQHQHSALMLKTLQHSQPPQGGETHEWRLGTSQEKVHLCDQIMRNLREMMKLVEGSNILPHLFGL
jgi:hypothetical protein